MIFLNSKMKQFYETRKSTLLSERLVKLIKDGVVFDQGFYLFRSFHNENEKIDFNWISEIYMDETGFECAVNSFHLVDYYNDPFISFDQVADISFAFLSEFESYWKKKFQEPCVVIIGINIENEFGPDAIIRFHKKRQNQSWIDKTQIENFSEAIMIAELYT